MGTKGIIRNAVAVVLAASSLFGATVSRADDLNDDQRERGAVLTERPGVNAIVQGPVVLRAYPRFNLGTIFLADATGGATVGACQAAAGKSMPVALVADRRIEVEVPAGKVACVVITKRGSQELLWKARRPSMLVAAR